MRKTLTGFWRASACTASVCTGAFVLAAVATLVTLGVSLGGENVALVPLVVTYASLVGMVPLLWALKGQPTRRAAWLSFVAGMAFFNATFWWVNTAMAVFGGIPLFLSIPVLQLLVAWCAMHWALAGAVQARLQSSLGLPSWLAVPTAWAACELMRNYFMSGYPWANLGYATTRNLYFSQVAALGGVVAPALIYLAFNAAPPLRNGWAVPSRWHWPAPGSTSRSTSTSVPMPRRPPWPISARSAATPGARRTCT